MVPVVRMIPAKGVINSLPDGMPPTDFSAQVDEHGISPRERIFVTDANGDTIVAGFHMVENGFIRGESEIFPGCPIDDLFFIFLAVFGDLDLF